MSLQTIHPLDCLKNHCFWPLSWTMYQETIVLSHLRDVLFCTVMFVLKSYWGSSPPPYVFLYFINEISHVQKKKKISIVLNQWSDSIPSIQEGCFRSPLSLWPPSRSATCVQSIIHLSRKKKERRCHLLSQSCHYIYMLTKHVKFYCVCKVLYFLYWIF